MNISKNDIIEFIKRVATSIALIFCFGGAYLHSALLFSFVILSVMLIILIFEWPKLLSPERWYFWPITLFYPVLPCLALINLVFRYHGNDFYLPLYPIFIAWTADTCGYFFGKLWGKHKMCPSVSPGKSWEGFAGSIIGIIFAHLAFIQTSPTLASLMPKPLFISIPVLSFFMATIAFLGGFFLSYLKRKQGLKDAGSLLPGHGGLLDRFDGVFFVTLVTCIMVLWGSR
jgi:phosphatidate cytidylyltransferase